MASTKTAISIEKSVLDQIDDLSEKLNISRSRFFAIAAEEFIKHHKAQELIKAINNSYDEPDTEEQIERRLSGFGRLSRIKSIKY